MAGKPTATVSRPTGGEAPAAASCAHLPTPSTTVSDLFSNFTYFTDPVNGDQFEQFDDRRIGGGSMSYKLPMKLGGMDNEIAAGAELRHDDISPVGLYQDP